MTNTLPDLRLTIAEGMEAMASTTTDYVKMWSLHYGAQTLRWCAAREAPSVEELQAALAAAQEEAAENDHTIEHLVANVRFAASKWEHSGVCPAGYAMASADDPCTCALVERRKSVLDAVA